MINNVKMGGEIHQCSGCAMCYAICPKGAIIISLSEGGFYMPVVNDTICINCGICCKVCYKYDHIPVKSGNESIICYSAINRNKEELKLASSGAVSIELMKECLKLGYLVVGVAYDTKHEIAVTRIASSEDELIQFRGSKYFQSYTANVFREIIQDKSKQKYAIFGTPCQIYAFSKSSEVIKCHDKYLFVDIFCHGCPSMNLWKKYSGLMKDKMGVSEFDNVQFRSKVHGWHEYCFDFLWKSKKYSSSKYNDPFYELYFGMDCMNLACYDCVPKSSMNYTDIRIGDFWGWQFDKDTEGVSAVIIQTEFGKELFERVKDKFDYRQFRFMDVIAAQSYSKEHHFNEEKRRKTLALLSSGLPIKVVVKQYRKMSPIKQRIKQIAKQAAKHLPQNLYLKLKQNIHKRQECLENTNFYC